MSRVYALLKFLYIFLILRYSVEYKYSVTRQNYPFVCVVYNKVAALYLYGNVLALIALAGLAGGGNRGAGTRTAGGGFAVSALPHTHFKGVFIYKAYKLGVYPLEENRSVVKLWSCFFKLDSLNNIAENHTMGISDSYVANFIGIAAYLCLILNKLICR